MELKLTKEPNRNARGRGSDIWTSVQQVRKRTILSATGHHLEIDRRTVGKAGYESCPVGDPDEHAQSAEAIP